MQPSQHGPFTGGVNAAAGSDVNPQGTVPRASNLLGIKRAALTTCDGSSILAWDNGAIQTTDHRFMALEVFQPSGVAPYYLALKQVSTVPLGPPFNLGVGGVVSTAPAIALLNPASGPIGTFVTIIGSNFGPSQGSSTVTIGGTAMPVVSWSSGSITVTIPTGATAGNVVVTVNGIASNGVPFAVTSVTGPSITSLTPSTGPVGTSVVIAGANFGNTQGSSTVTFGGISAGPTSWSNASGTVPVPATVPAGSASVIVTVGGFASNVVPLIVAPHINSLTPSSGPVGTSVVIAGTSFGATQGTSHVTLNGVPI